MLSEQEIKLAYLFILGRDVDPQGLAHYLTIEDLTVGQLRESLMASAEYTAHRGEEVGQLAAELMPHIMSHIMLERPWRSTMFQPSPEVYASPADAPFMQYSTCSGADFLHPHFAAILAELRIRNEMHRKLWEWVFVVHKLRASGNVGPGRRGLVFGVGKERLPALFAAAGAQITATDAPIEIGVGAGWQGSNEHASGLAAMPHGSMDRAEFEQLVEWRACDMNAIDDDLVDYDFCWSSCCFEHLGSLRHGMDFVIHSVEKCLRPGGTAVHTTEFNLTSNDGTVESADTCIYRLRDIDDLSAELRARGHEVETFRVAPDSLVVDGFVDMPPYRGPHLKLLGGGYVATSAGLVIRRRVD